jgi:rare lipoprotein A
VSDVYEIVLTTLTAITLSLSLGVAALSPPLDRPGVRYARASRPAPEAPAPSVVPEVSAAEAPVASVSTTNVSADTITGRVVEVGEATWYGDEFHGRPTASGELMDQEAMVAAHLRHAFGTYLRVTNQENGKSVVVRVVDRGPNAPGHELPAVVDVSRAAARELDMIAAGRIVVTVEVVPPPE